MKLKSAVLPLVLLNIAAPGAAAAAGCTLGKIADLPVTMRGLRPTVTAEINGESASFIIDSGAAFSFLTPAAVARFHLKTRDAPSNLVVSGIGGRTSVLVATPRVLTFGGIAYQRPDFFVSDKGLGSGTAGLLGANMTAKVDIEYDLANGVIRLFQADGCKDASLAYWAGDKPFSVIDIESAGIADPLLRGVVSVNGTKVRAIFDTGAAASMLDKDAAGRAGVTPDSPGVTGGGVASGIGQRSYIQEWIGPFASFKIGDEEIKNTRMRFGEMRWDDRANMLLGADFFLSHRIYVSRGQHKLYFTYNGGPVFNLGVAPQKPPATAVAAAPGSSPPAPYGDAPTDAVGYGRRAAAFSGRREFSAAVTDLTKAIALDPTSADYVFQRAMARLGAHQPLLALEDLNLALKLKPDDVPALLARAEFRAAAKNMDGARQDLAAASVLIAKDPGRRLALGLAYQRAGMWTESIAALDLWIAANPKADILPAALNARCWARAMLGQSLDKALDDCNAALRLLPETPGILDSRALVHLRRGEFARGVSDYDAVLRLQPDNAWALYGRGWARLKLGQKEAGAADIKAATALRPKLADEAKARGLSL